MGWRYQLEALLCAILLLASTLFVAARLLFAHPASGDVNAEMSNDQLPSDRRNVPDATSRAKDPKPAPRLQQVPPELATPTDLGSLWDEGPAYDLSQEGVDY